MEYIKKDNLINFDFVQIPRVVWNLFLKKEISSSAFKIYIEFFDRLKLSSYNNWIDKQGNVYIKYSYEELMKILETKSKGTVSKSLEELKNLNLIIQEKGFNTSSKFYLTNILEKNFSISSPKRGLTEVLKEGDSSPETGGQKSSFVDANNNNYNHNNINNITHTEDAPIFIQEILKKYNELNLPKYEFIPTKDIMNSYNILGLKKMLESLNIMSKSNFVLNNFSINMIFNIENMKKALNGSFKDKKKNKGINVNEVKKIEYVGDWSEDLEKIIGG